MIPRLSLPQKSNLKKLQIRSSFLELFRSVEKEFENAFFFESMGEETYDSRYSLIGFDPRVILRGEKGSLWIDDQEFKTTNPYFALREVLPESTISSNYGGGLVGYLAYEAINFFEPSLDLGSHPDFPPFLFGFYDDGLILDKFTGEVHYFYYEKDRSDLIKELDISPAPVLGGLRVRKLGESKSREKHREMVESTIEEIKSGNTFQCQIGLKVHYEVEGDLLSFYEELRKVNPSPHMYYLKFGSKRIIGASPELLFRLRQGEMESFPLAGTTKRGKTSEEDMELVRKLLNDPKEIAEHNMLIDLHRNDIGRVARFGTVKVRRKFDIKRFSHVQHISSEVVGIIRKDEDMLSGLAYSFPAGTLSGAPKIESLKIINRLEEDPRGPYGGAIGHFGFNGDCTFSIPIRTLFVSGEKAFAQASGGIVYDSDVDAEYQEIQNKLAAVQKALEKFEGKE